MKFLSGHLGYALKDEQLRRNVRGLLKYVAFLAAVVALYSVLFHIIMEQVEGQSHSWMTGAYWTLTVMSTLGFGDITFTTDIGRAFSILVLLSGVLLLLIVLPFAFIGYFYAPWLEAQLRLRAPKSAPPGMSGHVIMTAWNSASEGLAGRLERSGIPYLVVEEDGVKAASLLGDGVPVVRGDLDDVETYRRIGAASASLVVLNKDDLVNTNLALTVREVSASVPLAAVVEDWHAVDILELAGCNHVLPLKRRLGEQLANRVNAGHAQTHIIGQYRDLFIAEFCAHETPFAGKTLAECRFRDIAGVSIVGVWERGRMLPPRADFVLTPMSLPVVAGSAEGIDRMNEFLFIYDTNWHPVVVIGGGKVGLAAARSLKDRSIPVHMLERDPSLAARIGDLPDRLIIGDAADRDVMRRVGVEDAPSIILTTNEDATNIYLAAYCRRLNPEARIVSRITHDRNLASIQRAGADLTLSYTTLAVETITALIHGRPPILLGEGMSVHEVRCPTRLAGMTLRESGVGERTGLTIIGFGTGDDFVAGPGPDTRLVEDAILLMIGRSDQMRVFRDHYL